MGAGAIMGKSFLSREIEISICKSRLSTLGIFNTDMKQNIRTGSDCVLNLRHCVQSLEELKVHSREVFRIVESTFAGKKDDLFKASILDACLSCIVIREKQLGVS
jgi:hypothetical protein